MQDPLAYSKSDSGKLIPALKDVHLAISSGRKSFNSYSMLEGCAGLLVCSILDMSQKDLQTELAKPLRKLQRGNYGDYWQSCIESFCHFGGESDYEIFKKILEAGLSWDDLLYANKMSNPKILEKCSFTKGSYFVESEATDFFGRLFYKTKWKEVSLESYNRLKTTHKVKEEKGRYNVEVKTYLEYLTRWIEILEKENE